jgi:hypothetical protein
MPTRQIFFDIVDVSEQIAVTLRIAAVIPPRMKSAGVKSLEQSVCKYIQSGVVFVWFPRH